MNFGDMKQKYVENNDIDMNPDGCFTLIILLDMILIAAIVLVAFGSCRSVPPYVPPIREEIHDTVRISKTDTVNHYEVKKEKEFVYVKDSASTMVDNEGKVLKNEIWHNKLIIREKSDSIAHYKALVDSLMAVKQREKEVPVIVEKPLTKWEQRFMTIGKVSVGIGIGLLVVGIICFVLWLREKFGK